MIANLVAESKWAVSRLGKFTASEIDALLTPPKDKEAKAAGDLSVTAKNYIQSRAAEIITGTIREVTNFSIEWGKQHEPEAMELLKETYPSIEYMGGSEPRFFKYSDFAGGSPDGWSEKERLVVELKCPEDPANHVAYCLLKSPADLKKAERDYYHQIQFNMLCVAGEFGFDFMEMRGLFASYCPLVSDEYMKLKTLLIYPEEGFEEKINEALRKAESYLADIVWDLSKQ